MLDPFFLPGVVALRVDDCVSRETVSALPRRGGATDEGAQRCENLNFSNKPG
jgi:hypothetical protein